MKKINLSLGVCIAALVVSGCTGGTTYGTGTSHEEATIRSFGKIFKFRNKQTKINYKPRPELVMPANKNTLPQPVKEEQALGVDQEWPESPELRIAKVRAAAPEGDWRGSEDLPLEYLNDTEKEGIENSANSARLAKLSRTHTRSGSDKLIEAIRDDANGVGEGKLARERREQLSYSTGIKRKFLTEPPTVYRTPSVDAEAGDLGIDDAVLTAAQKKAKKEARDIERGVFTPGAE